MALLVLVPSAFGREAAAATSPEVEALLASLEQAPPVQTRFFERRRSALLEAPLQVEGRLGQPERGVLEKIVDSPFVERTVIRDGRVEVHREGERERRFALSRAPELGALVASFQAVLGGDAGDLDRHYRLVLERARPEWILALHPRSARLARRVEVVRLYGRDDVLLCIDLVLDAGEESRSWLGEAADAAREAANETARDALCSGATHPE